VSPVNVLKESRDSKAARQAVGFGSIVEGLEVLTREVEPLLRIASNALACSRGPFSQQLSSRLRSEKIRQSGMRSLDVSCLALSPAHYFISAALNQDSHDEFSAEASTAGAFCAF
jgi:hypothetical protein